MDGTEQAFVMNVTKPYLENTTIPPHLDDDNIIELRNITNQIQYFVCPFLFFIGLAGNICTILTVSRNEFRHLTMAYILSALAVSDSLMLCTNPFNQTFMQGLWKKDIRALSRFGCKLFFIIYRVAKFSSSWFIVLVAAERFVTVMIPMKAKSILQRRYIVISVVVVYIVKLTIAIICTFSTGIVNNICIPDMVTDRPRSKQFHRLFLIVPACTFFAAINIDAINRCDAPTTSPTTTENTPRPHLATSRGNVKSFVDVSWVSNRLHHMGYTHYRYVDDHALERPADIWVKQLPNDHSSNNRANI